MAEYIKFDDNCRYCGSDKITSGYAQGLQGASYECGYDVCKIDDEPCGTYRECSVKLRDETIDDILTDIS